MSVLLPLAIVVAVTGSFLVASQRSRWRRMGFGGWIFSNGVWVAHGWAAGDLAIALQFGFFLWASWRGYAGARGGEG